MASVSATIIKPKLTITWDNPEGKQLTAVVLAAERGTTLGTLVELLVEKWDLPVGQDEPIAYDLHTQDKKALDLTKTLSDLDLRQDIHLHLVSVTDRLVMAQPAELPVLEVYHPDAKMHVSLLTLIGQVTAAEVQESLERWWTLPDYVGDEPVYYELRSQKKVLPYNKTLAQLGIGDGSMLELVCQTGVRIIADDDSQQPKPDDGAPTATDMAEFFKIFSQSISDEGLLAMLRQTLPEEELKGHEKEAVAYVRQMMSDDDFLSLDAEEMERQFELAQQVGFQFPDLSDQFINIEVPPELGGRVSPKTAAQPDGTQPREPASFGATQAKPNTAAFRELLTNAFGDDDLDTFCFDVFREVHKKFSAGMSKEAKIQRLLEYCDQDMQWEKLERHIQKRRPTRYEQDKSRLWSPED
jgi:hypothetical protein